MENELTTVHVQLLGEGTPVWRPVDAAAFGPSIFRLSGPQPANEEWQFQPGQLVECQEHTFADGTMGLVAVRALPPNSSSKPTPLRGAA
jgi:hypothetical protein